MKISVTEFVNGEVKNWTEYEYKGFTSDEIKEEVDNLKSELEELVGVAFDSYEIEVSED